MDWEIRINEFLDVHGFSGVARQKMKANLMKLPEDKRVRFIDRRMEASSQPPSRSLPPTPHPAPTQPVKPHHELYGVRSSDREVQPCERCGSKINQRVHHVKAEHFDDRRSRGYFCSIECLDEAFGHGHYGSPHEGFNAGDLVFLLDDLWMMDAAETYQHEFPRGQTAQILTSPEWCSSGSYAVGKDGSLEHLPPYLTVSLLCQGRKYDLVYVGTLGFKEKGKLNLFQKLFG